MDKDPTKLIADIFTELQTDGDNGGFDPVVVERLKNENAGFEGAIDNFINIHTANRINRMSARQKEFSVAQVATEAHICELDATVQTTLDYVIKLDGQRSDCESELSKVQAERDAKFAQSQDERDAELKKWGMVVAAILALIEIVPRLLG